MEWGEAHRLLQVLLSDPSSAIAAALQGWDHPISREALILMDLFDLDHQVAAGKRSVQPHPGRPKKPSATNRIGDAGGRTPEQVAAILRAAAAGRL